MRECLKKFYKQKSEEKLEFRKNLKEHRKKLKTL